MQFMLLQLGPLKRKPAERTKHELLLGTLVLESGLGPETATYTYIHNKQCPCIWVLARALGCCSTPIWFPTIKRRPNVHRHAPLFFRFFQTDKNLSLTMIIYSLLFFPIKLFFLHFFFLFSLLFFFSCATSFPFSPFRRVLSMLLYER